MVMKRGFTCETHIGLWFLGFRDLKLCLWEFSLCTWVVRGWVGWIALTVKVENGQNCSHFFVSLRKLKCFFCFRRVKFLSFPL